MEVIYVATASCIFIRAIGINSIINFLQVEKRKLNLRDLAALISKLFIP